jgi:hypothetical protein
LLSTYCSLFHGESTCEKKKSTFFSFFIPSEKKKPDFGEEEMGPGLI